VHAGVFSFHGVVLVTARCLSPVRGPVRQFSWLPPLPRSCPRGFLETPTPQVPQPSHDRSRRTTSRRRCRPGRQERTPPLIHAAHRSGTAHSRATGSREGLHGRRASRDRAPGVRQVRRSPSMSGL